MDKDIKNQITNNEELTSCQKNDNSNQSKPNNNEDGQQSKSNTAAAAVAPAPQNDDNNASIKETKETIASESDGQSAQQQLSKSQLRKRKRREMLAAKREQRKAQIKQAKRIKAEAEGRDLDKERKEQLEREKSGEGRKRRDALKMKYMKTIETSFGVGFDCSFENQMTSKETNSLASQIRYAYAANKRSKNPCQIYVSSLKGPTFDFMSKVCGFPDNWTRWGFQCSDKDLVEMLPNKSKLVYLTSDSKNELEHLDDDKIYIIGGIVDRNRLSRAAINRAEALGLETAKLPISSYFKLVTTKVLTCNHVFEILLKYREYGNDWKKAMLGVLPQRKNAAVNGNVDLEEVNSGNEATEKGVDT